MGLFILFGSFGSDGVTQVLVIALKWVRWVVGSWLESFDDRTCSATCCAIKRLILSCGVSLQCVFPLATLTILAWASSLFRDAHHVEKSRAKAKRLATGRVKKTAEGYSIERKNQRARRHQNQLTD